MTSGGSAFYFHYDNLGSVTNLTSSSGTPQWTYHYEPFGATRTEGRDDPGAPQNSLKFTGELLDPTGLYYLRARQYDPSSGRFLHPDPAESPTTGPGISLYAYADNRPTVFVDPSGKRLVPGNPGQDASEEVTSPVDPEDDPEWSDSSEDGSVDSMSISTLRFWPTKCAKINANLDKLGPRKNPRRYRVRVLVWYSGGFRAPVLWSYSWSLGSNESDIYRGKSDSGWGRPPRVLANRIESMVSPAWLGLEAFSFVDTLFGFCRDTDYDTLMIP
jgi:RHS repeat-associated protein